MMVLLTIGGCRGVIDLVSSSMCSECRFTVAWALRRDSCTYLESHRLINECSVAIVLV